MDGKQQKILYYIDKWMWLREQGVTLTKYCQERNIKSVGVYGYGRLGRHLVWELEHEGFNIPWIMDQRYENISLNEKDYRVISPDDMSYIREADMVIITAIECFYDLEAKVCRFTNVEVISIEQLLKIFIEG